MIKPSADAIDTFVHSLIYQIVIDCPPCACTILSAVDNNG